MTSSVTKAQLDALSEFSTCEISDALVKMKVEHGGHIPDLDALSQGSAHENKIIGPAYTVKMIDGSDKDAPKLSGHFVDMAPAGSIMVISSPAGAKSASLGGLLALGATKRGVKGVVIDGRCRDLTEIRNMKLPVYARGHSTLGQSPFTRPSQVQVPITIEPRDTNSFPAATVNPGDLIVADVDGVVVVQPDQVDQVVELATKGQEVDSKCWADIEKGRPIKETFAEHRGK